ncbi:hypothetical protein CcCBS67573_g02560 [Chytriomyces confervae]|uniref:Fe2OG dioxygenase domain-containing protein n=1 Tax=Chytriomyces confervae TaxID=246404 RepID=A0A507FKC4_9FUNG|nr:hypothetical protein CcCBS67573_g02560 [Chytriomyces confervae]
MLQSTSNGSDTGLKPALCLPIPTLSRHHPKDMQLTPDPEPFDQSTHLEICPPQQVYTMEMNATAFPYSQSLQADESTLDFGITDAFQVLSDEGTEALVEIVERYKTDPRIAQSDNRAPLFMRGLGFVSPFIQELGNNSAILELVSQLAQEPLAPHSMVQNYAHINVGQAHAKDASTKTEVDSLHADSVDYVLVLMLTDPATFEGGELEAVKMQPLAQAMERIGAAGGVLDESEDVVRINFSRKGQGMFMRGSQFLHRVRPVFMAGSECVARVSCVFSFMSRNPRVPDATRFGTFANMSGDRYAHVEYARHKAWRVAGLLKAVEDVEFEASREDVVALLSDALAELQGAVRILQGKEDDAMPYFDAKLKRFVTKR